MPRGDHDHRWVPGQSGNPGGKPKDPIRVLVQKLAGEHAEAALRTIVEIASDPATLAKVRLSAATLVLDRAIGKAPTGVAISVDGAAESLLRLIAGAATSNPLNRIRAEATDAADPCNGSD